MSFEKIKYKKINRNDIAIFWKFLFLQQYIISLCTAEDKTWNDRNNILYCK